MHNEIKQLIDISKFAGERFDLVQAGGGNSSVKLKNGEMLIKASGLSLSEIDVDKGYTRVHNEKIKKIIEKAQSIEDKKSRAEFAALELKKAQLDLMRPSIETFLHAITDTCTLHTHPIATNFLMVRFDYQEVLTQLFKNYVVVNYFTPGIDLAIALKKEIEAYEKANRQKPKIMFLRNHGLFVSTKNDTETINLTEEINTKLAKYFKLDLSKYKQTNKLAQFFNQTFQTDELAYCSNDQTILEYLENKPDLIFLTPLFPDQIVYVGFCPLKINNFKDSKALQEYSQKNGVFPKIIIYQNNLYFIAPTLRKAREMEDVYKSHLIVADQKEKLCFLDSNELSYLTNWEAEKYRQKI